MGVESVELFGSVARDEAGPGSDVDVLVRLTDELMRQPWGPYADMEDMAERMGEWFGTKVDLATLPLPRNRFGYRVAGERFHVY